MITTARLLLRSLRYHWRTNMAVGLGVIAATAVLTGALIVGDSVRGSLRDLTLERLGKMDELLLSDYFFRSQLLDDLTADKNFQQHFASAQPAILFPAATVENTEERTRRAGQVFVVGCSPSFWELRTAGRAPTSHPADDEVVLNQPLAEDLGVQIGDLVTLRLPDASQVPADSTLGRKNDRVRSVPRLKVIDIIPAEGLGRFSLQSSQRSPSNVYVALSLLQRVLNEPEHVNAILVSSGNHPLDRAAHESLQTALQPTLTDMGLTLTEIRRQFPDNAEGAEAEIIYEYFNLTSDRMMLQPEVVAAARRAWSDFAAQPTLTYLADSITKAGPDVEQRRLTEGIPYSTITAIDSSPHFPLLPDNAVLGDDEIVLNRWAAEQLQAQPGDLIVVHYFQPETIHGEHVLSSSSFRLRHIVPLTEPARPYARNRAATFDEAPTIFNDPDLTPVVEGITDQESIEDWDAPFPFDIRRMKSADDEYWENHRTTPKAYISLATGQRIWGSRFGNVTSIRVPAQPDVTAERLTQLLQRELRQPETLQAVGLAFRNIKQEGIDASAGTTPFDVLFIALSFFIILSAVMLVALMFRLGIEQRAAQLGILGAVGLPAAQVTRLLVAEGALVAGLSALAGTAVAVGYAALMLAGLRSWWIGAVVSPFLTLHVRPVSVLSGYVISVLVSLLAIWLSARRLRHVPLRRLLAGQSSDSNLSPVRKRRLPRFTGIVLLLAAVGVVWLAAELTAEAQAVAFVGGGALVLMALLVLLSGRIRSATLWGRTTSLWRLSASSAARNPLRSILTIGLVASAAFLIVAMSAFRMQPTLEGTGGFRLLARSSTPVFQNLSRNEVRRDLMGPEASQLDGVPIFGFRVKRGDDASCRNLYRSTRPQVFGVPRDFAAHFDDPQRTRFRFAAVQSNGKDSQQQLSNPWHNLWPEQQPRTMAADAFDPAAPVPVILDNNTAMYSLHWYGGVGSIHEVTYEQGKTVRFQVVGLLSNTLLQGALLIGEEPFQRHFPEVNGYEFFLIDAPENKLTNVQERLEDALSDQGFDVVRSAQVLEDLLAVQNTYLSTFQSLGALGLLLGTFGVATVQIRSVFERRGELALLRAQGFRRRRVGLLVMLENTALLMGGLATGVLAAACAVLPYILLGDASVPLLGTLEMLAIVLAVGTLAGLLAVRASIKAPLLQALRGE